MLKACSRLCQDMLRLSATGRPQRRHNIADEVDDEELLSVFRAFATFGAGIGAAGSPRGKVCHLLFMYWQP